MELKQDHLFVKAELLDETLWKNFIDEKGILICNINKTTMKPFTEEELAPYESTSQGSTNAGRWTYEDTIFSSGYYLWSLAERYCCENDSNVKKKADRFFDDLFDLIQEFYKIEHGFIGKPWGGIAGRETTLDQTLYLCFGLHAYSQIADTNRKAKALSLITENVDWWIRHNYCNFQTPPNTFPVWLKPSHVSGMMTQVYLAYVHSGDKKYLAEVQRLIDTYQADLFLTRKSSSWFATDKDGFKVRRIALLHHAKAPCLWLLSAHWPQRKTYWHERFADQWNKELKLGLRDDGYTDVCVRVNLANEIEQPFGYDEAGFMGEPTEWHKQNNAIGHLWVSALKSGCVSASLGLSAVLLWDTVPWMRKQTESVVMKVLNNVSFKHFTRAFDPDGRQCFEKRRHWCDTLSSKGICAWLLLYWFSRKKNIIH